MRVFEIEGPWGRSPDFKSKFRRTPFFQSVRWFIMIEEASKIKKKYWNKTFIQRNDLVDETCSKLNYVNAIAVRFSKLILIPTLHRLAADSCCTDTSFVHY